ncbi:unnamed protein product [Bathycoccus prasinos]
MRKRSCLVVVFFFFTIVLFLSASTTKIFLVSAVHSDDDEKNDDEGETKEKEESWQDKDRDEYGLPICHDETLRRSPLRRATGGEIAAKMSQAKRYVDGYVRVSRDGKEMHVDVKVIRVKGNLNVGRNLYFEGEVKVEGSVIMGNKKDALEEIKRLENEIEEMTAIVEELEGHHTLTDENFHTAIENCLTMNNGQHRKDGACEALHYGERIGDWDVGKVSNFTRAFTNRAEFNADLSRWNTSSAKSFDGMFENAVAFNGDVSKWKSKSATTKDEMFRNAVAFKNLNWHAFVDECLAEAPDTGECTAWSSGNNYGTMPNWDTSSVTDMSSTFEGYAQFDGDVSRWDTSSVATMTSMFKGASSFNQDIGGWNTEKVTSMEYMFHYASAFNQDISSWTGTAATTAQSEMFLDASAFQARFTCTDAVTGPARSCVLKQSYWSASYCPLGSWVYNNDYTTHETNPGSVGTPEACIELVRTECPTAKIANMGSEGDCWCQYHDGSVTEIVATNENNWMACLLTSSPDPIPDASWHTFVDKCLDEAPDTGECTTWASENNYGTMPNWDVSLVTNMKGYDGDYYESVRGFADQTKFNGDISKWDTSQVTSMISLFWNASDFNQDIARWDTSRAEHMDWMFGSTTFNQDISGWSTAKVTSMWGMFYYASAFNQDIGGWNTEKVTDMRSMFSYASAFNQDIGGWNTEEVTSMEYMFHYASAFNQDISSWTGTAATTAQSEMFLDASAFQARFTCTDAITGPANSCFERLVNLETCSVLYEAISPVLPVLKAATVDFPADHSTFGSNYAYYVYAEITTGSTFTSYEDVYLLGGTSACGSWFGGLYHGRPFIGTQCNWGSSTAVSVDQTTATVALQANQAYRIQWMYNVAEGYRRAQIKVDGVVVVDSTTAYLNVDSSSTEEFLSIGSGYHTQVSETLQGSVKKVSVHICGENI